MKRTCTLELTSEEEGGYPVSVPALPACYSQGETFEEALANVREAIEGHVAALEEMGEPIPDDVTTATVEVAA